MANKRFRNADVAYIHNGFKITRSYGAFYSDPKDPTWDVASTNRIGVLKSLVPTVGSAMRAIDKYRSGK